MKNILVGSVTVIRLLATITSLVAFAILSRPVAAEAHCWVSCFQENCDIDDTEGAINSCAQSCSEQCDEGNNDNEDEDSSGSGS